VCYRQLKCEGVTSYSVKTALQIFIWVIESPDHHAVVKGIDLQTYPGRTGTGSQLCVASSADMFARKGNALSSFRPIRASLSETFKTSKQLKARRKPSSCKHLSALSVIHRKEDRHLKRRESSPGNLSECGNKTHALPQVKLNFRASRCK